MTFLAWWLWLQIPIGIAAVVTMSPVLIVRLNLAFLAVCGMAVSLYWMMLNFGPGS